MSTSYRPVLALFVAPVAALVLSACSSSGELRREDVAVAAVYGRGDSAKNTPSQRLDAQPTYPAAGVMDDAWWRDFGDERLDRLVGQVLKVNNNLAVAGLLLKRARLAAGLATDDLLPHVSASVNASTSKALDNGAAPSSRQNSAGISINYELDLFGRLRAQRDVARWEAEATEQDLQSTTLALIGDTCDFYWTLGFLNQRIVAGEESLARVQRTLDLVRSQFNAGAVSKLEVREAEQNLLSQQTSQSQLLQQRVEIRNALTVLLSGEPWPQDDEPQDLSAASSPEVREGIPAELLGRRPDLRAVEIRLRATLRSVDVVRRSYYPAISLTGSAGGSSASLGDVLKNPVGTLGAGLSLPFLNWNERRLNVAISKTDYQIAVNDFRMALYTAFTEVDNALSAREALARQVESSQKSFDAAVEIEHLYEVRYRSGATPLRTWLDAQELRRNAEISLAQARLNQLQNDSTLFRALGGGT